MIELLRRTPSYLERQARRFLRCESEPPSPTAPAPYRHALDVMGVDFTDIVLVIRQGGVRLAENLAGQHPSVTVHLLVARPVSAKRRVELPPNVIYTHCPDVKSRLRALSSKPQPQLIIERGLEQTGERVDTFRELFGIVAKGGQYVIDSVPDPEAPLVVQQEAQRMAGQLAQLAEHAKITHGGAHSRDRARSEHGRGRSRIRRLDRHQAGEPSVEAARPRGQPSAQGACGVRVGRGDREQAGDDVRIAGLRRHPRRRPARPDVRDRRSREVVAALPGRHLLCPEAGPARRLLAPRHLPQPEEAADVPPHAAQHESDDGKGSW